MNNIINELIITLEQNIPQLVIMVGSIGLNKGIKKYFLDKELSIKNIKIKESPKILDQKRNFKNIDNPNIKEFVNILDNSLNHVNLNYFYRNIQSVKIKNVDTIKNSRNSNKTVAQYSHFNNLITLSKDASESSIHHELLHLSSSISIDKNSWSGFSQKIDKVCPIGYGLNEGYTALLTNEFFNGGLYSYPFECKIAFLVENIVGQEEMEKLYFEADLKGLISILEQYSEINSILRFIKDLDFYNEHNGEKHNRKNNKKAYECYDNALGYILTLNIKKTFIDYKNGLVSQKRLISFIHNINSFLDSNKDVKLTNDFDWNNIYEFLIDKDKQLAI